MLSGSVRAAERLPVSTFALIRRRLVLDLFFDDLVAVTLEPFSDLGLHVVAF
jgi:hypothetical protein